MQALRDELKEKNISLSESLNKIRCAEVECTALRHMLEKEKEDCQKEITARLKDSALVSVGVRLYSFSVLVIVEIKQKLLMVSFLILLSVPTGLNKNFTTLFPGTAKFKR